MTLPDSLVFPRIDHPRHRPQFSRAQSTTRTDPTRALRFIQNLLPIEGMVRLPELAAGATTMSLRALPRFHLDLARLNDVPTTAILARHPCSRTGAPNQISSHGSLPGRLLHLRTFRALPITWNPLVTAGKTLTLWLGLARLCLVL